MTPDQIRAMSPEDICTLLCMRGYRFVRERGTGLYQMLEGGVPVRKFTGLRWCFANTLEGFSWGPLSETFRPDSTRIPEAFLGEPRE